jgi:hypothetical protein
MLITIAELRNRVASNLASLVDDLQTATCRYGMEEANAWRESLPRLSRLLSASSMQPLHLYCAAPGDLSLEYQLPASGSFADVVLLGAKEATPSAVVIELKHWVTRSDRPGRAKGLIERQGIQELHPSEQVRGYVEYCRRFHSAVQDAKAKVQGCVLFTRDFITEPYVLPPNTDLAEDYPIFTLSEEDVDDRVPATLSTWLTAPHPEFARAFENGRYRQDRGFVRQVAAQILDTNLRPFELLDNQRRAFALCCAEADAVVAHWRKGTSARKVLVVKGPPGSGKSAVAVKLWAHLSLNDQVPDGDLVFMTTSLSQNTNWTSLFESAGANGARGLLRKASAVHPVSTGRLGQLRVRHGRDFLNTVSAWRANLETLANVGESTRDGARDQQYLITIVDEAHSLINTERDGGVGQFGFAPTLGPQGYHVIRTSTLTIFFLDPAQGFRHRENTSVADLREWARELGAGELVEIDLSGVQFRCAGSTEYVDWLEGFLDGAAEETNRVLASAWYVANLSTSSGRAAYSDAIVPLRTAAERVSSYVIDGNVVALRGRSRHQPFDFRLYADPFSLEQGLREQVSRGASGRLLSSYSRPWATRGSADPHRLPLSMQDFHETVAISGQQKTWGRVWNVVPATDDYSYFVQGLPGSRIADDPLCEVGCPYAVRGFDYDYVGVLWLEDLIWRDGKWVLNLENVHESGVSALVTLAKRERNAEAPNELLQR